MRIVEIQKLAELMERYSLTALRVGEGESRVELERAVAVAAPAPADTAPLPIVLPEAERPSDGSRELRAPMVGVFYAAPSPGGEPFVKVGDRVKEGDVVCIIEAMKLMNEICAESDGEIVEICAENGQLVEYDQPLFRIK